MPEPAVPPIPAWMPALPPPFERSAGGVHWRVHQWGGFEAPPLVLLHGFGSDGRAWAPLAEQLAADWRVIAIDLPGHGGTPFPASSSWNLPATARALTALLPELDHRPKVVLGYSLGGRLALHLALEKACRGHLRAMVLVGASAGLPAAQARADRVAADALWIERLGHDWPGFWTAWDQQPVFATRRALPSFTRAFADWVRQGQAPGQLAAAMAAFGLGRMAPLHERLAQIHLPVSVLVGERDEKFRALAQELLGGLPAARFSVAPGAGHDVPLEAPSAILDALRDLFTGDVSLPAPEGSPSPSPCH